MNTSQKPNNNTQYIRGAIPSWLLPVLPTLLLLLMPSVAKTAQFGDFSYERSGSTISITNYTGSGGAVAIPSTIDGLPVTGIGFAAFGGCTSLTSVTIPNSVTSIGIEAFARCSSLMNLTILNGVTSIEDRAFSFCTGLTKVTIPNSVKIIQDGAFSDCAKLVGLRCKPTPPVATRFISVVPSGRIIPPVSTASTGREARQTK